MKKQYRSHVSESVHKGISNLYSIGLVDNATMRRFDQSCLTPVEEFCPDQVRMLRKREHASQAVLAEYLGVSAGTVSQWESGRRTPDGPARKLLGLAITKGLDHIR